MDAASVLNRYRDRIAQLSSGADVSKLKREILGDLERNHALTPALRTRIDRGDFFTVRGLEATIQSIASSTTTAGRATSSYLALLSSQTPSDQVSSGRGARTEQQAQIEVDSLLRDLIGRIHADTNEQLLETLADRALHAARQLSCDITNHRAGKGIQERYTAAFTRSLQRIGIDFEGDYWARAKVGKAGCDRLEIGIRNDEELAAAFTAETKKPIAEATRDQIVDWFMKRKPDQAALEALAFTGAPSSLSERVAESFLRGLVTSAGVRGATGEEIASFVGNFGWNWLPRDARGEPDALAVKILAQAYRRIGLSLHLERRQTYEPGKSGSLERARLAHAIANDSELSAAFQSDTKKDALAATADELFAWFQKSKPRLDQVLRIATTGLPDDERGLRREEILDLLLRQAQSNQWNSTALIVVQNSLEHQRRDPLAGDLFETAFLNLTVRLADRLKAHPELGAQIAKEQPKDVVAWFEKQPPNARLLIELAGI